jgi:hypothetical protein
VLKDLKVRVKEHKVLQDSQVAKVPKVLKGQVRVPKVP